MNTTKIMNRTKESFIKNRLKSIGYSLKGIWILIKTESSIKIQLFVAVIVIFIGFLVGLSILEWIAQCIAIGLVLVAEALNTSIEKIADFIHPEYNKNIGSIKDIGAGAAGIAAIISLVIAALIYIPKLQGLF